MATRGAPSFLDLDYPRHTHWLHAESVGVGVSLFFDVFAEYPIHAYSASCRRVTRYILYRSPRRQYSYLGMTCMDLESLFLRPVNFLVNTEVRAVPVG